jgi:hypothetical protein
MNQIAIGPIFVIILVSLWLWDKHPGVLFLIIAGIVISIIYMMLVQKQETEDNQRDAVLKANLAEKDAAWRASLVENQYQDTKKLLSKILLQHSETLVKKYRQSVYEDDYGVKVFDKWFGERDYFIDKVLCMECPGLLGIIDRTYIASTIDEKTINLSFATKRSDDVVVDDISPIEFEHYCANLLLTSGWEAKVTKASGDQGIDIIGSYSNFKVVFQCKKYSQPVGNSAVQEIIAGKIFERADIAAVVTNTSFTPSARQLASSANVFLLHYTDIPKFAKMLELA